MRYFTTVGEEGFECLQFLREEDLQLMMSLDGRSLLPSWMPPVVRTVPADDRSLARRSDFPFFASWTVVMRAAARQAVGETCEEYGELLPLHTTDGETLFAVNVVRVIDALDRERSEYLCFPGTTRIMFVRKAVFRPDHLQNVDIFRLPGVASDIYVSERFVRAVRAAKLEGLRFPSA